MDIVKTDDVYLDRPRLHNLLNTAMNHPLVIVCAGSGYGKTRAVQSFLKENNAVTSWIQLSERDNVTTHFWEKYARMISLTWPAIGARLKEIGIPETEEIFAKYTQLRQMALSPLEKHLLVFDDFHILHNPAILNILEKIINDVPSNATVILLTRTMPDFNIVGMMMKERVFTIREDTLCFTEAEIAEYFQRFQLSLTKRNIQEIYNDTKGWAFAVNLIGRSLGKDQKYERYALEAMKKNVFRLIEAEISQSVSKPLWRFLLRISLVDHLAANLIRALAKDRALVKEMERLNAYIRYDYHLDTYMIHHLFLDFLKQRQYMLTDEERRETYQKAGEWCEMNAYQIEALSYFEKSGDWGAILRILNSFRFQTPRNLAKHVLEILGRAPKNIASKHPLFPAMHLKMLISLGLVAEAFQMAKRYIGEYRRHPGSPEKDRVLVELYGNLGLIQVLRCPFTDNYEFSAYFEKMREYYDKHAYSTLEPAKSISIGAYALLVGSPRAGAPERYIEELSRAVPHMSHVLGGCMYGLDDLAQGELQYLRKELDDSEQHLKKALDKARAKNQYSIQDRALLYFMLISISHGDIKAANASLKEIESLLEVKDFATRFEAYDIARCCYYLSIGQTEQVPDWLKTDLSTYAHPVFWENFANQVRAQYHYYTRQYKKLLAFLQNEGADQTLLVGRILFKVIEALSLYHLKRREAALAALSEAYRLAAPNRFITPFIQFSKDMRTLTTAALRDDTCTIPKDWLENINLNASAFSKRQAIMISEFKIANQADNGISLTDREKEILRDLSLGLSRTEIAESKIISVNTVKLVTNIIYEKLCANSLADAIRFAKDRRII